MEEASISSLVNFLLPIRYQANRCTCMRYFILILSKSNFHCHVFSESFFFAEPIALLD
jgi:hypothetical protein